VSKEEMDSDGVVDGLRHALTLQHRSVLQFEIASASLFGLEYQSLADKLWKWSRLELEDARLLVEKIVAIGGEPSVTVAEIEWAGVPEQAVGRLIETETEAIEALQDIIPSTGDDGRSEALEHTLEHLIMRKQGQLDYLFRARRSE
jgi:bacterioferritin (cytochrome b1)